MSSKKTSKETTPNSSRNRSQQTTPTRNVFSFDPSSNVYRPQMDAPIFSPNPYYAGVPPMYSVPPTNLFNNFQAFSDFQPDLQHQMQPQTQPQTQYQTQTESDSSPDHVSETQPEPQPEQAPQKGKAKVQHWSREEEVVLARSWIDISEDGAVGTNQQSEHFWRRILERFHNERGLGNYRTKHQINTKFRDVSRVVMKFNGLYNNLKTQRKSGQTDQNVLETALEIFRKENNRVAFKYIDFWRVVEPSKKWHAAFGKDKEEGGSKRTKTSANSYTTSSDARINFDLNVNDDELELEEVERPPGREKCKRKGAASQTSGSMQSVDLSELKMEFAKYNETLNEHMNFKKEKHATKQKDREERKRREDMEFLMKPTDDLDEEVRQMVLAEKKAIMDRYRNRN